MPDCRHCGADVAVTVRFCPECGSRNPLARDRAPNTPVGPTNPASARHAPHAPESGADPTVASGTAAAASAVPSQTVRVASILGAITSSPTALLPNAPAASADHLPSAPIGRTPAAEGLGALPPVEGGRNPPSAIPIPGGARAPTAGGSAPSAPIAASPPAVVPTAPVSDRLASAPNLRASGPPGPVVAPLATGAARLGSRLVIPRPPDSATNDPPPKAQGPAPSLAPTPPPPPIAVPATPIHTTLRRFRREGISTPEEKLCPQCGVGNPLGAKYCTADGFQFEDAGVQGTALPLPPAGAPIGARLGLKAVLVRIIASIMLIGGAVAGYLVWSSRMADSGLSVDAAGSNSGSLATSEVVPATVASPPGVTDGMTASLPQVLKPELPA